MVEALFVHVGQLHLHDSLGKNKGDKLPTLVFGCVSFIACRNHKAVIF